MGSGRFSARSVVFGLAASALLGLAGQASAAVSVSNGALFRTDASGTNQNATTVVNRGGWTTQYQAQNTPGNYGAQLFFSTSATPSSGDFFAPDASGTFSFALAEGANTIYFWADGDDTAGGSDGFGLNLFFNGAAHDAPLLSALHLTPGSAFQANGSSGCTASYTLQCIAGANSLSGLVGGSTVTLTDFTLFGLGGGSGGEDRVYHDNVNGFTFPVHGNGVNDTYGSFTLQVRTPISAAPEPATWGLLILGFATVGGALRSRRRSAVA